MPLDSLGALLLVSALAQVTVPAAKGSLKGRIADVAGAAIQATIHVIRPDTNEVATRLVAEENGMFDAGSMSLGEYSVVAFAPGFFRRRVEPVIIEPGQSVELGEIRLGFSGCDSPGMNCDYFSEVPEDVRRIVAQQHVTLNLACGVDLDAAGKTRCSPQPTDVPGERESDVQLLRDNRTLYLAARNGATLSAPYASSQNCSGARFNTERIAVVGLGKGVDFCVRTRQGSVSHVFFDEEVSNESTGATLWYVTRKPSPRE